MVDCLGEGKIILMNKDFDPVLEVPICSEVFSEGQFSHFSYSDVKCRRNSVT